MKRHQHLERATELAGDDLIPVEITRVRLRWRENHAARHGIDKLLETPRHPEVLRLNRHTPAPQRHGRLVDGES